MTRPPTSCSVGPNASPGTSFSEADPRSVTRPRTSLSKPMKPFVQSRLPLFARRLFPFALALALPAAGVCAQPSASDPYEGLARYQFGQSRQPLALIEAQIRQTAPSGYPALEARLLEVLNAPQTTPDGKRYICRWLALVGSPACVPAVAPLHEK